MSSDKTSFESIAIRYCDRQDQTPAGLLAVLQDQKTRFKPVGWMLLQCEDMSSSSLGTLTILPYGGEATFKDVPNRPISPRGLASDMSMVVEHFPADELPESLSGKLQSWVAPPAPAEVKKSRKRR